MIRFKKVVCMSYQTKWMEFDTYEVNTTNFIIVNK